MSKFEIIHRVDSRLQTIVVEALDPAQAQEILILHFERKGWVHGEILNIEEI